MYARFSSLTPSQILASKLWQPQDIAKFLQTKKESVSTPDVIVTKELLLTPLLSPTDLGKILVKWDYLHS